MSSGGRSPASGASAAECIASRRGVSTLPARTRQKGPCGPSAQYLLAAWSSVSASGRSYCAGSGCAARSCGSVCGPERAARPGNCSPARTHRRCGSGCPFRRTSPCSKRPARSSRCPRGNSAHACRSGPSFGLRGLRWQAPSRQSNWPQHSVEASQATPAPRHSPQLPPSVPSASTSAAFATSTPRPGSRRTHPRPAARNRDCCCTSRDTCQSRRRRRGRATGRSTRWKHRRTHPRPDTHRRSRGAAAPPPN